MQRPWFIGPHLKVGRANHHIREFQSGLHKELANFDGYRIRVDKDSDSINDILEFEVTKPVDVIPFTLVAGDAIHNLRSALDHLWTEIAVRIAGAPDNKRLYFPMHETRDGVITTIKQGPIKKAAPDICELVIDHIKPYRGGNLPLWSLNKLDNIDKHRMPILIGTVQAIRGVSGKGEGPDPCVIENCSYVIQGTAGEPTVFRPMSFPKSLKMKITDYGHPIFDIVLSEATVFEGRSALPLLYELSDLVFGVIETLKAHMQRR